jgi:hypothetical protein
MIFMINIGKYRDKRTLPFNEDSLNHAYCSVIKDGAVRRYAPDVEFDYYADSEFELQLFDSPLMDAGCKRIYVF